MVREWYNTAVNPRWRPATHPNREMAGGSSRQREMNADGPSDVDAYLLSSTYRRAVLEHLGSDGPATPKEIAASTDKRRPHVSRAIGELEEMGIVELRVDEGRRVGRYYGLTEEGDAAWNRLREEIRHVPWSVEPPDDTVSRRLVDTANAEVGDALRTVLRYDGERVRFLYVAEGVLDNYTDEEVERAIKSFVFDHKLTSATVPHQTVQSEATTFTDISLVRVGISDGSQVAVTFENEADVEIPRFTRLLGSVIENADP